MLLGDRPLWALNRHLMVSLGKLGPCPMLCSIRKSCVRWPELGRHLKGNEAFDQQSEGTQCDPSDLSPGSVFRSLCLPMDRRHMSGLRCQGVDRFVQRVARVALYTLPADLAALGELQKLLPEVTVEDRLSVSP
jgi:hypothetical protein